LASIIVSRAVRCGFSRWRIGGSDPVFGAVGSDGRVPSLTVLTPGRGEGEMVMKFTLSILVMAFMFTSMPARAQEADKVAKAETAVLAWLALTDAGDSARSWDQAASIFQASITQQHWMDALTRVRGPLGSLVSRKIMSAQYATSLPGAPDGEYVVIRYETEFTNTKEAIETVTPCLEKDGPWKVSGYYIK
jgi:hypothetical protein